MRRMVEGCDDEVTEEESNAGEDPMKRATDVGMTFSSNGCFDCNICLDFAVDPVVTLCGHLYCWPCIYKWFQQSASTSAQQCPVCKAVLSQETLVPLYGRGDNSKKSYEAMGIPHRPSGCRGSITNQRTSEIEEQYQPIQSHNHQQDSPYVNATSDYMLPYSSLGTVGMSNSTASLLAGMAVDFLPLIFRNQRFSGVRYSSPFYTASNSASPRVRRQELELQKALNQIWLFLLCCAILCLFLF